MNFVDFSKIWSKINRFRQLQNLGIMSPGAAGVVSPRVATKEAADAIDKLRAI